MNGDTNNCSTEFFLAFSASHGSYSYQCACGRTYFASQAGGWADEGELEKLKAQAAAEPDKFIDTGEDEVSMLNLDGGREHVLGCACGAARQLEILIWSRRHAILNYLKSRSSRTLREAQAQSDDVDLTSRLVAVAG